MSRFSLFLLILQLLNFSTGQLEIFKEEDGVEMPVSDKLEMAAGKNLTLICRFNDEYYWRITYLSKLAWGWKRGNIQFNDVMDLKNMAESNSKLHQFDIEPRIEGFSYETAVKTFKPLLPQDSGTYFCMDYNDKLFQIIDLSVHVKTDPDNLNNYLQVLNKSQSEFNFDPLKNYITLPKFLCSDKLFMCNSGTLCVNYTYVCDGISDCNDASDENLFLCGHTPCKGRGQNAFSGRRCCCEKDLNLTCVNGPGIFCWVEDNEHHYGALHNNIPYKFEDQLHPVKYFYSSADMNMEGSSSEASIIVIIISSITTAIVIILGIIFRRRLFKVINNIRSGNPQDASTDLPSSGSGSVPSASTCIPNLMPSGESRLLPKCTANAASQLKPPSYDEVVANTQPTAPAFEKCMA